MKLYIGVTKDNELFYIEFDKEETRQKKYFSLCGGLYDSPKTESQGEEEAREVLEDESYFKDIGYLENTPEFIKKHIDFKSLADEILNTDGWENIKGEYNHFGEYNNEEIYLSFSSCGQHKEEIEDLKEIWINKEDLIKIYSLWDKEHLKPLKEKSFNFMNEIFNKYVALCDEQEVLNKYLKAIKW